MSSAITPHNRDYIAGLIEGRLIFLMNMIHFPLVSWKQVAVRVKWRVCNEEVYSIFLNTHSFSTYSDVVLAINKYIFD